MPFQPGDRLRVVQERARVHVPTCIARRGECGCSLALIPQPARFLHNDQEVSAQEYADLLRDYRRLRDQGRAP